MSSCQLTQAIDRARRKLQEGNAPYREIDWPEENVECVAFFPVPEVEKLIGEGDLVVKNREAFKDAEVKG